MIEGCLSEHRTRRVVWDVRWLALAAACLTGCATQARREVARPPSAGMTSPPVEAVVPTGYSSPGEMPVPMPPVTPVQAPAVGAMPGGQESTIEPPPPPLPASLPPILPALPQDQSSAGPDDAYAAAPIDPPRPPGSPDVRRGGDEAAPADPALLPVACPSCGDFHPSDPALGPGGGCGPGGCIPGRQNRCYPTEHATFVGRFFENLYQCLCCPDPCYEPTWIPEANAAFFVDAARPRSNMRLRLDDGHTLWFPDRSEYFWARSFRGPGPQPKFPTTRTGRPILGERTLDFGQLNLYFEAATKRFSFFTEIPYRATYPELTAHHAGFADMNIGTKSLLLDCDLIQFTFQFRTFFPIGNVLEGLGNGHVSLEPSFLMAVHLAPQTYLQGQLAEWIPIGADPNYAGAILHYHLSLNQTLCRLHPDVPLIGTLEFSGWSFQDGAFTAPLLGPQKSSGNSYFSLGPGLRMSVCKNIDFGVGTAFALGSPNWAEPLIRSEVRIFY